MFPTGHKHPPKSIHQNQAKAFAQARIAFFRIGPEYFQWADAEQVPKKNAVVVLFCCGFVLSWIFHQFSCLFVSVYPWTCGSCQCQSPEMTKGMTYCFINVELGGHKGGWGSVCMFVWMYVCIYLSIFSTIKKKEVVLRPVAFCLRVV